MSFAVRMCLLMIVSSLVREDDLPEASAEKGTQDMQTSAAEGTPAAKPRSITISHTPGQGITLHIDEGLRAAIAEGVKNDVFAAVDFTTKVASALTESDNAPIIKKSIFEAVRTVIMGTRKPDPKEALAEAIAAYQDLLFYERDKLNDAEAAMQGPVDSRPRPEDLAVMRNEVAFLEAKIAQLRADQAQEATAPTAASGDATRMAQTIEDIEAMLASLRADLAAAEASWNAPENERKSYEEINSLRASIQFAEGRLAFLKGDEPTPRVPDNSVEPAAPAAELPTEMASAQPV